MKFKTQAVVVGARQFNDAVEGTHHDFTKVRVLFPTSENDDNSVGFQVKELTYGDHKNFAKFESLKFPVNLEIELLATDKGYDFIGFTAAPKAAV